MAVARTSVVLLWHQQLVFSVSTNRCSVILAAATSVAVVTLQTTSVAVVTLQTTGVAPVTLQTTGVAVAVVILQQV